MASNQNEYSMKILVCISHVPDTTSKINFTDSDTKFDTNGVQFVINPYDEFVLTRAMWFKEKQGASVTVVNVGNATTEPTLRKALAIGADDAIRINTEAIDGFSVAKEIAEVVKNGGYDLVLAGKESSDYNGGAVPCMIADMLNIPFVNACNGLIVSGNNLELSREIDGGIENIKVQTPVVIGGQKGLVEESELKIPNMRGIMTARTKPLEVLEASGTSNLTESISYAKPAAKGDCKMIDENSINELVNELHNVAKVI